MLVGYARVSKADDSDTAAQVKALRQAGYNLPGPQPVRPDRQGSIPPLLEHVSPIERDNVVLYGQLYPRSEAHPPSPSRKEGSLKV